jgi:hypothetical protein
MDRPVGAAGFLESASSRLGLVADGGGIVGVIKPARLAVAVAAEPGAVMGSTPLGWTQVPTLRTGPPYSADRPGSGKQRIPHVTRLRWRACGASWTSTAGCRRRTLGRRHA